MFENKPALNYAVIAGNATKNTTFAAKRHYY